MAYFSLCTLKISFYWLLSWIAWWEICYYFNLYFFVHNASSFIWLIFKIFTLSQFIFMCFDVLCFLYFGILWVSWICKFIDFFQIQKTLAITSSNYFSVFFPPSFWDSSYRNAGLLYIIPQLIRLFSVFFFLCYCIWHNFYCYDFNFTNIFLFSI